MCILVCEVVASLSAMLRGVEAAKVYVVTNVGLRKHVVVTVGKVVMYASIQL